MFDTLWNKAISAQRRIKELDEGITPIRTRILYDQDEIIKEIKRKNNCANKLSICSAFGWWLVEVPDPCQGAVSQPCGQMDKRDDTVPLTHR